MSDQPTRSEPPPPGRPSASGPWDIAPTLSGAGSGLVSGPAVPASATVPHGDTRYILRDEIARGGMGVVHAARDTVLERDVAIKLLQETHAGNPYIARRFVEEARITGQLQHPGIPAVHDLGTLPDGRPFLAMKLIKGRTLADLLSDRPSPTAELPRFLGIFEQICHTVAYAHSHGVIHRDLKPANVMVGAFGEVQVMDWGLAKFLGAAAPLADPQDDDPARPETHIEIGRTDLPDSKTRAGTVVGTLPYMPPEQALGMIERVDRRSDVFGLGAVLCEILTGQPPYSGNRALLRAHAELGLVDDALARVAATGVEAELVNLVQRCLAKDPADRLADAGAVAAAVTAHRVRVEERVRRAEVERVRAETAVAEQRKRARMRLALAGVVILLLAGGGAVAVWAEQKSAERKLDQERAEGERKAEQARFDTVRKAAEEKRVADAKTAAERLASQEQRANAAEALATLKGEQTRQGIKALLTSAADHRAKYRFAKAAEAVRQARALLAHGTDPALADAVAQADRDRQFAEELDAIRMRKFLWHQEKRTAFTTAPEEYHLAFLARGFDLANADPTLLAAQVNRSAIRREIIDALDTWSLDERDTRLRDRLLAVARIADPGTWSDAVRDPALRNPKNLNRKARLGELAAQVDPRNATPGALATFAELLTQAEVPAIRFLTTAQAAHPTDFRLAFTLAFTLGQTRLRQNIATATGYFLTARSIRPENATVALFVGVQLFDNRDRDAAAMAYRDAVRLDPSFAMAWSHLGIVLQHLGHLHEGLAAIRESLRLDPDRVWGYVFLGNLLEATGDLDGAEDAYRAAIRLNPDHSTAQRDYGMLFKKRANFALAVAHLEKAVRLDSKQAGWHYDLAEAWRGRREWGRAIAEYDRAIALNPDVARYHSGRGIALRAAGRYADAIAAFEKARRLATPRSDYAVWVAQQAADAGQLADANRRLPAVLAGRPPGTPAETLALARVCAYARRYADAVRFFGMAFDGDASLVGELGNDRPLSRYNAACAAALAAAGDGVDPAPGDPRYRRLALNWLSAELAAVRARPAVKEGRHDEDLYFHLTAWLHDPDFATVRHTFYLAALPPGEAKAWLALWAEIRALRDRVAPTPTAPTPRPVMRVRTM